MTKLSPSHTQTLWVIILAAGKGKRMRAKEKNKVAYEVSGVPMISRTISLLKQVGIKNIIVVVGFEKESVIKLLDSSIITVEQKKRLGTGHAVKMAIKKIPKTAEHVLVLNGDDSFLFSPALFKELFETHSEKNSAITFLTIDLKDPSGLGRIIRNANGKIEGIVEEKDATQKQKKIKEINAACYLFSYSFLKNNISKLPKSHITGEYYIVSLIEIAAFKKMSIETLRHKNIKWRGVNTIEELEKAEQLIGMGNEGY